MAVLNVHRRRLALSPEQAGRLLDSLSGRSDELWPHDRWPAMRLDGPLAVGARGGHGSIRYRVEAYAPGSWVRFRFTGPRGFLGYHEFCVRDDDPDGGCTLEHTIVMRLHGPGRLIWPLAARWLHDALIEDALDRADPSAGTRRWTVPVRVLRRLAGDRADRPVPGRPADLHAV